MPMPQAFIKICYVHAGKTRRKYHRCDSIQFNSISAEGVASSLPLVAVAVVVVVVAGVDVEGVSSHSTLHIPLSLFSFSSV